MGLLLTATILFASGCAQMRSWLEGAPKPSVGLKGVKIQDLSLKDLTLLFDVEIQNPYRVALPLLDVGYRLDSAGSSLLQGTAPLQGTIPASGRRVVGIPATIRFADILKTGRGIRPGAVVPYDAMLGLGVRAPGVGKMTLPIRKKGEFPIPTVPKVELRGIRWDNLSWREAAGTIDFYVQNTNDFPVDIKGLDYALSIAGSKVGRVGLKSGAKIDKGRGAALSMPIRFSTIDLGAAFLDILGKKDAAYSLDGAMDVATPYGKLNMPFVRSGKTTLLGK